MLLPAPGAPESIRAKVWPGRTRFTDTLFERRRAGLVQDHVKPVGLQSANGLRTRIAGPDGAAFATPASPTAANAIAIAVITYFVEFFVFSMPDR